MDHGEDQSVVVDGPFEGRTLHELVTEFGDDIFGRDFPQKQFPLLFKYLDCQKTLSVQVHPNDEQAAQLDPPDLGKTEAWYVVAAEPGSKVYAGLKPGVDRVTLERELARGTCDTCLHEFEAQVGQCIFIEAGTVHAIGAGLIIAEIQQASDTTYRLFDWNRVDRDSRPRSLHVAEALEVINFKRGPVEPIPVAPFDKVGVSRMVECDKFNLDVWHINQPQHVRTEYQFHLYSVIDGGVTISVGSQRTQLGRGDTILIPGSIADFEIEPQGSARFLDMYLP